jgi:hypothetical protein
VVSTVNTLCQMTIRNGRKKPYISSTNICLLQRHFGLFI